MKNSVIIGIIIFLVLGAGIALLTSMAKSPSSPSSTEQEATLPDGEKAVVYKTSTCGCCKVYTQYLPKEGLETDSVDVSGQELDTMRAKYNIPDNLASCHITKIGNYFVSGHIPVEAITKLLAEQPDIAGIALAGMPSGTPGMPGPKNESWVIYAIDNDGGTSEFMTI